LPPHKLVLASSSPRRQELLRRLVPQFDVATSGVEEVGSSLAPAFSIPPLALPTGYFVPPETHPTLWAWRKAVDVCRQLPVASDTLILAADTIVIGAGRILGKPLTGEVATQMLAELRGKKHHVATGLVLLRSADVEKPIWQSAVVSVVRMREYSDDELWGYVATGEPLDKAGAYAIQGLGGKLVAQVEGCYYNVVGLPLCEVRSALLGAGVEVAPFPAGGYCAYCPLRVNQ